MQMPREIGTFHIIGIGGIGMSAIAEILLAKGYSVQGSDQKDSANVRRLRAKGVRIFIGHDAVNLVGARYVVISSAVKADNPELVAARGKGLQIIRRAEILAELMRLYSTVSVTGTHGKTTTTSLIAHIFADSGVDPTVISGGIMNDWGTNARLGQGEWMIVEADESDGTFVRLPTQIGIVTNIDPEHLDFFGSVENMHRAFETFYRNIPFYGLAVTCIDHPVVREMIERLNLRRDGRRLITYGVSPDADIILRGMGHERGGIVIDADLGPRVRGGERAIRGWFIPVLGQHNALNALAAIASASEAGLPDDVIRASLGTFTGVKRRFECTGMWHDAAIYDDYAHHPAEIAAVLAAARPAVQGKLIAVFEPHRYSRVHDLFGEFCACFGDADSVVVAPLYSAGEQPLAGIDSRYMAEGIRATGHPSALAVEGAQDLVLLLRDILRPGDTVVCLGAGTLTEWAHALPDWLAAEEPRRAAL